MEYGLKLGVDGGGGISLAPSSLSPARDKHQRLRDETRTRERGILKMGADFALPGFVFRLCP